MNRNYNGNYNGNVNRNVNANVNRNYNDNYNGSYNRNVNVDVDDHDDYHPVATRRRHHRRRDRDRSGRGFHCRQAPVVQAVSRGRQWRHLPKLRGDVVSASICRHLGHLDGGHTPPQ